MLEEHTKWLHLKLSHTFLHTQVFREEEIDTQGESFDHDSWHPKQVSKTLH